MMSDIFQTGKKPIVFALFGIIINGIYGVLADYLESYHKAEESAKDFLIKPVEGIFYIGAFAIFIYLFWNLFVRNIIVARKISLVESLYLFPICWIFFEIRNVAEFISLHLAF